MLSLLVQLGHSLVTTGPGFVSTSPDNNSNDLQTTDSVVSLVF